MNTSVLHRLLMLFSIALLLGSCGKRDGGNECSSKTPCEGFGQTCKNGFCEGAVCNTSAECPIEQFCGDKRSCQTGCERDNDCYPGDRCLVEQGTCAPAQCEDAHLDCGFREYCNVSTGECYDAGEQFCRPCSDDVECGDGNYCYAGACLVDCSSGRECPSGFECAPLADQNGNIIAYQCFTYCWLYEDYRPGSF